MAKVNPGDATGRKKVELAEAAAKELADRAKEISLANANAAVVDTEGLFDPVSGLQIDPETGETFPAVEDAPAPEVAEDPDVVVDLTGADEPASAVEVADFGVQIAEDEFKTVRMNTTLEDVTIGAGNHYKVLEEGKQYRLPRDHAEYLDGMGYVWGGTYRKL